MQLFSVSSLEEYVLNLFFLTKCSIEAGVELVSAKSKNKTGFSNGGISC